MWIVTVWTKPLASWTLLDILGVLVLVPVTIWIGWAALLGLGALIFVLPGQLLDRWRNQSAREKIQTSAMTVLLILGAISLAIAIFSPK